jgi:hypothetical protein
MACWSSFDKLSAVDWAKSRRFRSLFIAVLLLLMVVVLYRKRRAVSCMRKDKR